MNDAKPSLTSEQVLSALNHLAAVLSRNLGPKELMAISVEEFRRMFDADRAWLLYPCDPQTPECQVIYEASVPEYPGLDSIGGKLQVSTGVAKLFAEALAVDVPFIVQEESVHQYDLAVAEEYSIKSLMCIALKLQNDRPWLLGLHQCSYNRGWAAEERDLFRYASQRLREAYNSRSLLKTIKSDIAKRQSIEASLTRSEHRFRALFHHSSVSLWLDDISALQKEFSYLRNRGIVDLQGYLERNPDVVNDLIGKIKVLDVNEATLLVFEGSSADCFKVNDTTFFPADSYGVLRTIFVALYKGSHHLTVEVQLQTLKGKRIDTLLTLDLLPEPESHLLLATVMDITEQKATERKFHESQAGYQLLMETANDAIFVTDIESRKIIAANKRASEMTGLSSEELIGVAHESIHPIEEIDRYKQFFFNPANADYGNTYETVIQHCGGKTIPVEVSSSRTYIDGREVVQTILHDISVRIKREEQQKLLATVVEQIVDSVIITDTMGCIEYVNPSFERISGYALDEVLGKNPRILNSGKTKKESYKLLWKELGKGNVWHGVFHNKAKDGTLFEEEATIAPVRNGAGEIRHYVGIKRDITSQSKVKKQVRQAQKMQAIGILAGGVAHDFNNILTAIMGFAELSLLQCQDKPVLENNIHEIIRGADRAGKLIKQILTFSRQTEKNVATLRLAVVLKEALKLLRASLPANIDIIQDIDSSLKVRVDPTQMHQVVMNLCTNAYQSIRSDKGCIEVSLKSVEVKARQGVELGNISAGKYVCLSIKDNGGGISSEHLSRIFEPYFTTREKNEGTGLGLSVVHGIVTDHGGAINVLSEIGKGSSFEIYLPEISSRESKESDHRQVLVTGHGRVMIVDDEKQIVGYEMQVLQRAGYQTICFTDSQEALNTLLKDPDSYDLLVTDMAMPNMTGLQLFREIRKVRADFPVLLCTGYSEHVTVESSIDMGINGYLAKPFTAEQFALEVKRVLDARSTTSS